MIYHKRALINKKAYVRKTQERQSGPGIEGRKVLLSILLAYGFYTQFTLRMLMTYNDSMLTVIISSLMDSKAIA
jgi:hypothetical protein